MKTNLPRLASLLFCVSATLPLAAGETKLNGHTFTLPDGFQIELIAASPLIDRPISADFDEQGRLYVTESSGTNDKVEKQLQDKPHRIVRLADTDGDGKFDQRIVYAEQLMFPEGALWHDGSLYVAAPPSIWKFTDTNGDGVADQRVEWFQGKTLGGCANDLHGPYLGHDGWIYWCKGAFNQQSYTLPNGRPFVTKASHIFRCRPDGSGLEPVMTGGMDNPVDVVFTPGGERIFTTTFFQHPGGGRRDGLIHALYGGVYGKQHDVVESHPRTGELLPVLTHLGPAAPCGLAICESNVLGADFPANLLACNFNLRKVTRHVLEPSGATFRTADSDFVVSNNFDFHPTDVQEDADGSIVVVDTGGWYKLCCPTSQLWKPDILGAIYRVKRTNAKPPADPRGLKLAWDKLDPPGLAKLLADERPAVRRRATHLLGKAGPSAAPAVSAVPGVAGVWALTRIDSPAARAAIRDRLADGNEVVRQAALHSISLWRDAAAIEPLHKLLASPSLANRRAAAEAIGRCGGKASVPRLLDAAAQLSVVPSDETRMLEHSLAFALIEIADAESTRAGLADGSPMRQRVALLALDQMQNGGLEAKSVTPLLSSPHAALRETATWIVGRHGDWGDSLTGYFRTQLAVNANADLATQLARFCRSAAVQELVATTARETNTTAARVAALNAMREAALKETPKAWGEAIAKALGSDDFETVQQAVLTARSLPPPKEAAELTTALRTLGQDRNALALVRLDALAALPGGLAAVDAELFEFLRTNLAADNFVGARAAAAEVLAKARLSAEQLDQLTESLKLVGPLEIDRLLFAFQQTTDEKVGLKLVARLRESPVLTALRPDALRTHLAKYPAAVQERSQALFAAMNVDLDQQRKRLDELLTSLPAGDVRRGQSVFNSAKAACSACHQFGYVGGNLGPDLTRIGRIRQDRDLLEAIVFPNASFVRSYEPLTVVTVEGKVHNGIVKKDASDEIILATGPKDLVRIPRAEVEEVRPGKVSVMPSGLEQQLTREQLADLIEFLQGAK